MNYKKLIAVLLITVLTLLWWFNLTKMERWLFINKNVVEDYLLSKMSDKKIDTTPEALIDTVIVSSAKDGYASISFHDNHSTVLVFVPNKQVTKKVLRDYDGHDIKTIDKNWYVITILPKELY